MEKIKKKVQKVMHKRRAKTNRKEGGKWFDEECRSVRKELIRTTRACKRGEISKDKCIRRRKEYRELIGRKKDKENQKRLREVEEDKTMGKFWKAILTRKRRIEVSEKIRQEGEEKAF